MAIPNKIYFNWIVLCIASIAGIGTSLWGYYQILNIQPPTSLEIQRPPRIIVITSPKIGEKIKNPILISGNILLKNKTLSICVKDKNNHILKEASVQSQEQIPTPFNLNLNYSQPTTENGFIEISEFSSETEINLTRKVIPILFFQ